MTVDIPDYFTLMAALSFFNVEAATSVTAPRPKDVHPSTLNYQTWLCCSGSSIVSTVWC